MAVVIGANAAGSAVAHRLHRSGLAVVLLDGVDPAWTRRGRAYTDAWYYGTTELAATPAVFCASLRSIPAVLDRGRAVAATTWSAGGVAAALQPYVVVDARAPECGSIAVRLVASMHACAEPVRIPLHERATPVALRAPEAGRFHTRMTIGAWVEAGEPVGAIGGTTLVATGTGRLLGLAARGARVAPGALVAEIDPSLLRDDCFGLEPEAEDAATRVLDELAGAGAMATGEGPGSVHARRIG